MRLLPKDRLRAHRHKLFTSKVILMQAKTRTTEERWAGGAICLERAKRNGFKAYLFFVFAYSFVV